MCGLTPKPDLFGVHVVPDAVLRKLSVKRRRGVRWLLRVGRMGCFVHVHVSLNFSLTSIEDSPSLQMSTKQIWHALRKTGVSNLSLLTSSQGCSGEQTLLVLLGAEADSVQRGKDTKMAE